MKNFAATSIFAFSVYALLTAGSGNMESTFFGLWSVEEMLFGIVVALIAGFASHRFFCKTGSMKMANPARWLLFAVYFFGPFLLAMAKANLDVAQRVLTGRIRPGIVRIETGLNSDLEVLMLANSITLTPGTLTVDVDEETNDLFVHWIYVEKGQEKLYRVDAGKVCGSFPRWARRIMQ